MELAPGDRLGPYEITAPIGAGGMGQVYKARDTRLDRTVAIKILPALLASDPQFRERFDREARVISQLDHPNICALHDVGQHNGTAYLVMPYLEGETLEDRLQRGAIPADAAVPIATQIADALARAHASGIIHRDLKPANIMLTKSGARLLDFGLARAAGSALTTVTQTQPARLTSQGTIIGTFHYMAPEQIEGAEGDARTDVWSFGCVLYEMLTGARPFDGKTTASVLANILNAPVAPVRQRRPGISRALDHIVTRCLEKNPDARWQAVADIAHQLRWAAAPDDGASVPSRSLWGQPAAYVAALLVAAAAFAAAWLLKPAPAPAAPLLKLAFVPPAGLTLTPFGSNGNPQFALSPDGSRLAYVAAAAGRAPSLWVQRLDSRTPREVPGSADANAPFWSRDSQQIGFFSQGRLRRSGLDSEESRVIASTDAISGTWSGEVILVASGFGPVMRVPATGGALAPVTTVEPGEVGHRWPQFLPDGRHFVFSPARRGGTRIASLDSPASALLLEAGSTPVVADAAHLLFVPPRATTLQAQPIEVASQRLDGAPRDILERVRYVGGSGFPPASVSTTGLLAYWDGTTVSTGLRWYDRAGNVIAGLPVPDDPAYFVISPDDRRLAYLMRAAEGGGVWLMDLLSGVTSRLTLTVPGGARPIWSRDGATLSVTTAGKTGLALLRRAASGGAEQVLGEVPIPDRGNAVPGNFYANDWSRDGRTALVSVTQPDTGRDIVVFSTATGRTTPFVNARHSQVQPRFSPDERWVAYSSNETGRWEVFVEAFPGSGVRQQLSHDGGAQPLWRRDGRELFYAAPDGTLMALDVTPGDRWVPAAPRALFRTRMRPLFAPYPYTYDVSGDGQRFLLSEVQPGSGPVISLVTDWRAR